ncbi:MAG: DedA family protein [Nocardioidaceae bacterium]
MLHTVTDALTSLPPAVAYLIVVALVFGEAAVFLGFVLPGETAVLFAGFLASQHKLSVEVLCLLVVVAAIIGDSVGYEVGKHFGPRLLRLRVLAKHRDRIGSAQDFLRRRGGSAVFLGRFTAFLRAVMPGLAGLSQMPYRRFLAYNAAGGIVWGIGFTLIGFFAGKSYDKVARYVGTSAAVVLAVIVLGALVVWHFRKKRAD